MRPVARIAQSVEQGIENPRVLGSIPSPGTTIQKNPPMAGFLLLVGRTLHRTPFDDSSHPCDSPLRGLYLSLYFKKILIFWERVRLMKSKVSALIKTLLCHSLIGS